jgi:hypothetical protein
MKLDGGLALARVNKMNKKQIKQVREAVRESRCFKVKSFLDVVPTTKDYMMTANVAKLWYSKARLPREQYIRYLVSKGNLTSLEAHTGNDFYNAMYYLRLAYQDAIEEVEIVARNNCRWQQLSEAEKSEARLGAYAQNSDESEDEDDCWEGQQEIVRKSSSLSQGSPRPEYDFGLLRRIRSGLKYWEKRVKQEKTNPLEISLKNKTNFLQHLDEILEKRK